MIPVEKNIPIPPAGRVGSSHSRRKIYPWDEMDVGDSIFVLKHPQEAASLAAQAAKSRDGWGFTVRLADGGSRIWRIS